MKAVRSLGDPALCPVDGIVIKGDRIVHVAVRKPHGSSVENVDPCVKLLGDKISEGADIGRNTDDKTPYGRAILLLPILGQSGW